MASVSIETAERVWTILVEECGADERNREDFIRTLDRWNEYRFMGTLGFGGKVWNTRGGFYVTCYKEDETVSRRLSMKRANERLKEEFGG